MNYPTRAILAFLFGDDPLRFSSNVVGIAKPNWKRVRYSVDIPGIAPHRVVKMFWRLRQKKLIKYHENGNKVSFVLTEAGKEKMLSYRLDDLVITKPKRWDNQWHIVAFDIPEKNKAARNALADKLKQLGLIMLQKSLWVYPFYCKDEIDFVAEIFGVGKYIHYIVVQNITNDSLLRRKFGLG